MQLISKFDKEFRFLFCVIDIYSRYVWVISLKDEKGITITNAFQKVLDEWYRKPNKIWPDKSSEFYNRSMKSWLETNDIEMYSTHNKGKSVAAEIFIRTLKNKIISIWLQYQKCDVYIDKLDDIIKKYINNYHSRVKMKPVKVKSKPYIDSSKKK